MKIVFSFKMKSPMYNLYGSDAAVNSLIKSVIVEARIFERYSEEYIF